ncbi:5680_t:CDS:2, partial [Acaulospora colombiana]
ISSQNEAIIQTNNVQQFSVSRRSLLDVNGVNIDGKSFPISSEDDIKIFRRRAGSWRVRPLYRIISTEKPLIIIIPKDSESGLSLALRLAHNLATYLRLDIQILYDNEAISQLQRETFGCSNLIIIGGYNNKFGQYILSGNPSPIRFTRNGWTLASRTYETPGIGKLLGYQYGKFSSFE